MLGVVLFGYLKIEMNEESMQKSPEARFVERYRFVVSAGAL
jgi:hypothetical protein